MPIRPRDPVPTLDLATVGGVRFNLAQAAPKSFTMLVVYRGLHCPICKTYLHDLDSRFDEFAAKGVEALALSTDPQDRATQARRDWGIERLPIAYGLSIDQAREWGLFVSRSIRPNEPALFAEPGIFLIRPDRTLYCSSVQTMPFARPSFGDVLNAVAYVTANDYPARGES